MMKVHRQPRDVNVLAAIILNFYVHFHNRLKFGPDLQAQGILEGTRQKHIS